MTAARHALPAALALLTAPAAANEAAIAAFAAHCFDPRLTADSAAERLGVADARVDFYDLRPAFADAPSPGTDIRPGADRRCEVAFDGDRADAAAEAAAAALAREGITDDAPLPDGYAPGPGTALLAARFLNPNRVAVVHVGTRPGPGGTETFMQVERQAPRN